MVNRRAARKPAWSWADYHREAAKEAARAKTAVEVETEPVAEPEAIEAPETEPQQDETPLLVSPAETLAERVAAAEQKREPDWAQVVAVRRAAHRTPIERGCTVELPSAADPQPVNGTLSYGMRHEARIKGGARFCDQCDCLVPKAQAEACRSKWCSLRGDV